MNYQSRTQLRFEPSSLGGIMLPVSAMSINCFMDTGYRAKATFISPLSTRFFNSPKPRIPPTKSIRLSERSVLDAEDFIQYQVGRDGNVQHTDGIIIVVSARFGSKAIPLAIQIKGEIMQSCRFVDVRTLFFHRKVLAYSRQELFGSHTVQIASPHDYSQ